MTLVESCCSSADLSAEDWEEILTVTHAAFAEHAQKGINMAPCTNTMEQHKLFLNNCQIFLIREDKTLVAYKAGRVEKNGEQCYFQVQLTCVLPSYKGKGLGKKVHALLEQWAIEHNCQYLQTDTSCKAKSSLAYHHAIGFRNWYFCHFNKRNYNSIVLRKDLLSKYSESNRRFVLLLSWISLHAKFRSNGAPTLLYRLFKHLQQKESQRPPKGSTKLQLKEIQQTAFNLLLHFDELCQKHNLKYLICYGTLLGAIRHNGFIPWDDDIDVTMPLPDYEKLLNIFHQINDSPQVDLIHGMKKNVGIPFAMLVDKKTITYTPGRDKKHSHPIAIDIFPAYALSDEPNKAKEQVNSIRSLIAQTHTYLRSPSWFHVRRRLSFAIKANHKLRKLLRQINDIIHTETWGSTKNVRIMSIEEEQMLALPYDVFESYTFHDFECAKFRIPACAHEHLTELYGDYMQLPPKEARQGILTNAFRLK